MTKQANGDNINVDAELVAEIDASVEANAAEAAEQRDDTPPEESEEKADDKAGSDDKAGTADDEAAENDAAPEGEADDGKPDGDGEADGEEAEAKNEDVITDEHLERAVKAGFTMADARKFGSAELLESTISRLEEARKDTADNGDDDDGEAEDPLADIPDLDPEDYDEKIVAGFKAMKEMIRSQYTKIQELRKGGDEPSVDEWFDGKMEGLDKPVAKAVKSDPKRAEAIRGKYDVLVAGYKAAGQDVSRGDVFKEAVGIAMGDVIAKVAIDAKSKELSNRQKQHTQRASGNGGESTTGDVAKDIANEIDRKFDDGN